MTEILGKRLWIVFGTWNTWKWVADEYSFYAWELYLPWVRVTWFRQQMDFINGKWIKIERRQPRLIKIFNRKWRF